MRKIFHARPKVSFGTGRQGREEKCKPACRQAGAAKPHEIWLLRDKGKMQNNTLQHLLAIERNVLIIPDLSLPTGRQARPSPLRLMLRAGLEREVLSA